MHDRLSERETFAEPLDRSRYRKPLVLAPHPDDEVYGCAGLLTLWSRDGVPGLVVLLTAGERQAAGHDQDPVELRLAESTAAASLLGYRLLAWSLPDRGLRCDEHLIGRLTSLLAEHQPDVVLTPALTEPHPDHQATTLSVLCALARLPAGAPLPDLLLYESGGSLTQPNTLVDISEVRELKDQAMAVFASQESVQPYRSRIAARDHFRALQLGPQASAAEAFTRVPVGVGGWPAVVPALEPLWLHSRRQAAHERDVPLVSVMVRTMGDAHLEKTLACIAAQTYPRLQCVIVAAHGPAGAPGNVAVPPGVHVQWVSGAKALNRPEAGNAALREATGQWLIFLDDDDLWSPDHIQRLMDAVQGQGHIRAVHSDVQVVDHAGGELTRYDEPWNAARMAFTNVLPIHSVLFDASLVRRDGCRFDESLPVLEDWDFWLQVTRHTDVLHVPGVSAIYRYRDRSGLGKDEGVHQHRNWRDHVQARWLQRLSEREKLDAIAWYARRLDESQQRARRDGLRCTELESRIRDTQLEVTAALRSRSDEAALAAERQARLESLLRDTQAELAAAGRALHSRSDEAARASERCAQLELQLQDARVELAAGARAAERCARLEAQLHDARAELAAAGQRLGQAVFALTAADELRLAVQGLAESVQTEFRVAREQWQLERQALVEQAESLRAQWLQAQSLREDQARTIAAIHNSSSWRLTRPWRWLGHMLRSR